MPRWAWAALGAAILVVAGAIVATGLRPSLHTGISMCRDGHEANPDDRTAIVDAANDVLLALRFGDPDRFLRSAHPLMVPTVSRDALERPIRDLGPRLQRIGLPLAPQDIKIVEGDLAQGGTAYCYLHEPDGLLYRAAATGSEPRALVTFRIESKPMVFSFHVELWRHDGRWSTMYFRNTPSAHNGRDSNHYVQAGDAAVASGDRIAAWMLYRTAESMAVVSTNVITHEQAEIQKKVQSLATDKDLGKALQTWTVGDRPYAVNEFGVTPTGTDDASLGLIVQYQRQAADDASKMFEWLKATHPILAKHFDAVIFQAKDGPQTVLHF